MTTQKMEGMRAILRSSLGRSLRALTEADRLAAAWPVACGRAMAEHGEIVSFFEGTMTVAVSDPTWLQQMVSMRTHLQHEVARIAQVNVTGIHFEMKKR
jgi:hypothetical protein